MFVAQSCPTLCDPWTVACQTPLSMDSPGKNSGVGCHALLQWIFPTQGSNPSLPYWQVDSLSSEPPGKPKISLSLFKYKSFRMLNIGHWAWLSLLPPPLLLSPDTQYYIFCSLTRITLWCSIWKGDGSYFVMMQLSPPMGQDVTLPLKLQNALWGC